MTTPEPESGPESEDAEIDLFAELGVETTTSDDNSSDGLEAFMDDDDEDEMPIESVPVDEENHEDDDDDDDLFATLGVAGPSVSISSSEDDDILAAFMDDSDEVEDEPDEDTAPISEAPVKLQDDAVEAYRMVLETVWVDGILDPGEVHLLAKRREDLGVSFEKHLEMVREMLG